MSFISTLKSLIGLKPRSGSLSNGDRRLTCLDCRANFIFDAGEQSFFQSKGFSDPKRCPHCRKKVRSRMKRRSRHHSKFRSRGHHRRYSVIDGDSPYADDN